MLLENRIEPNSNNLGLLDELWDEEERFHEEKIKEVINKIRSRSKQVKLLKKKIINEVKNDVSDMGFTEEQYEIQEVETTYKGKREKYIQITFALKGNKKIIEHLESKGWIIDRRYKNDNGDPSIWLSDLHGKNRDFKFVMIVLKYIIERD